jgi:hypothetical protein
MEPSPALLRLTRPIARAVGDGDVAFVERRISHHTGLEWAAHPSQ